MSNSLKNQKNHLSSIVSGVVSSRHLAKNVPHQCQGRTASRPPIGAYADVVTMLGKSMIHHGPYNDRIYLFRLSPEDIPGITGRLHAFAKSRNYSRIFARIPATARDHFISSGYMPGACIPGLYQGEVDGYYMANYRNPLSSDWRSGIDDVLTVAQEKARGHPVSPVLEPGFTCTPGILADAPALAAVYREIFLTYPVPIHDPAYLLQEMQDNLRCFCIRDGEGIAATASAAVDPDGQFAEMTGFATLPGCRGHGFAGYLLHRMESDLCSTGIKTAFAVVRARSHPANITFARRGYTCTGTLAGCVNICGALEDMNIWYKPLDGRGAISSAG